VSEGGGLFRRSIADLVPYEPGKPVDEVQRELGLERIVKLASNEGPYPPFPAAVDAIARSAGELNRYPDGGVYALRAALAALHGVAFEEVVVGAGADGVIDLLSQATLEPGDEIVCGWPSSRATCSTRSSSAPWRGRCRWTATPTTSTPCSP